MNVPLSVLIARCWIILVAAVVVLLFLHYLLFIAIDYERLIWLRILGGAAVVLMTLWSIAEAFPDSEVRHGGFGPPPAPPDWPAPPPEDDPGRAS